MQAKRKPVFPSPREATNPKRGHQHKEILAETPQGHGVSTVFCQENEGSPRGSSFLLSFRADLLGGYRKTVVCL